MGPEAMWGHKVKGDEQMGGDVGMVGDRMGGDVMWGREVTGGRQRSDVPP